MTFGTAVIAGARTAIAPERPLLRRVRAELFGYVKGLRRGASFAAKVKDKRVLTLMKAFPKAGRAHRDAPARGRGFTGTPLEGILSPLLANIALAVLDEHMHGPRLPGGR